MLIDKKFMPMASVLKEFRNDVEKLGGKDYAVTVERNDGLRQRLEMKILKDSKYDARNAVIIERLVKSMLWVYGGFKIISGGCDYVGNYLKDCYSNGGTREFDVKFMSKVFESNFEVEIVDYAAVPKTVDQSLGRHYELNGCRIGFDAGGSDRKVSAVIDGEAVYSEEVVWNPKITSDPMYHYNEIVSAFKTAASHMPRVDGIGISSAGVYINNRTMAASLFVSVPEEDFEKTVKNIYINAAAEIGKDIPVVVANDGDITALAGAMSLNSDRILGIAMGTSEAGGYVDEHGNIRGWLNELAFVPVDFNKDAMRDPWSQDVGVGATYFSQDSVIKLAGMAGVDLSAANTPAEKLKIVQKMLNEGSQVAADIFSDIGTYLAHSIVYYLEFYNAQHLLILGRVTSGKGGDIIIEKCNEVLKAEYPSVYDQIKVFLPDEKARRVGQSIAAASLPTVI